MKKAKSIDLNDFFIQVLLNDEYTVSINKVKIRGSMHHKPKTFGIGIESTINGFEGLGTSVESLESAFSIIRSMYLKYTGEPLPETTLPPERPWYIDIVRGGYIPICISRYQPNIEDFLITNQQTGEEEYHFTVPKHLAHNFDFDRSGDIIFVPKYNIFHRSLTDYIPKRVAFTETSHL